MAFRHLFTTTLLSAFTVCGIAQTVKQHVPVVALGHMRLPEKVNGKLVPVNTTRQEMLANALLLADVNNCPIVSYKLSIIAPGQKFYGPIYIGGGELTDTIKHKLKSQDGPNVKVYIEDIRVNFRGTEMGVAPLAFKYDN